MLLVLSLLAALVSDASALLGVGEKQTVAVQGRLVCDGKPAANVYIKMYDNNIVSDSLMGDTHSDVNGYFQMVGSEREFSTAQPKVNFYHDCDNGQYRCPRKFTIDIPQNYVTQGATPTNVYDFGQMELSPPMPGESHDCIH